MADSIFVKTSDVIGRPSTGTEKKEAKSTLGKDDFLKILMTQMQNQDPMQPMQDKEFIAQMAQFTSVEQLTNMSGELKLLRQSLGMASSLIGKTVSWMGKSETGELHMKSGVVDSIIVREGTQFATVKGEEIPLESLTKIENNQEVVEPQPDEKPEDQPEQQPEPNPEEPPK